MKHTIFFGLIIASLGMMQACKTAMVTTQSQWRGINSDSTTYTDSKSDLQWRVTNDSTMLYLSLMTRNRSTQLSLAHDRLVLYFDTTCEKRKESSVIFAHKKEELLLWGEIPDKHVKGSFDLMVWKGMRIDPELERTALSANYDIDTTGLMSVTAAIPLRMVDVFSMGDSLTMGIVIDVRDRKIHADGSMNPQSSAHLTSLPSAKPHVQHSSQGTPDGSMGVNAPSGGWEGDGHKHNEMKIAEVNAKIWFLVKLAKQ